MKRKLLWIGGIVAVPAIGAGVLFYLASNYIHKISPYIREQAVGYMRDRYGADVELEQFNVELPGFSPIKLYLTKGVGTMANVTGSGISVRKGADPLLRMKSMRFELDLGKLFDRDKNVKRVVLEGVEIVIPPKGERPALQAGQVQITGAPKSNVVIEEVLIGDAKLTILPKDKTKQPLQFELKKVQLQQAGINVPFRYEASIRNAKPPGDVTASGSFGPWNKEEPGETPLSGDYLFEHADLSVFSAIRGTLRSTGKFEGRLNALRAKGEATVPDFALKISGNKLPLHARFDAEIDGTNGNTKLTPVHARLGKTAMVVTGGVLKHDGDTRRTTDLDVVIKRGHLEDVLRLAMRGDQTFMTGMIDLKARVLVPPLTGKVIEKLKLNGTFTIADGKFLKSAIQDKIDQMSRQAQAQPKNEEIDQVVSNLSGRFQMANEQIHFDYLTFAIPGADMALEGDYNLDSEHLGFKGDVKLKARVSQTQTGWKRWALKPVDPFFSKDGAGTYSKIMIDGSRKNPRFARAK